MEIKTSPSRRKCKYRLCKNILSIYNHGEYCHAHSSQIFMKKEMMARPINKKKQ